MSGKVETSIRHVPCKSCGRPKAYCSDVNSNLQGNQVRVTMKCDECGATWSLRRFGPAVFQARRFGSFGGR